MSASTLQVDAPPKRLSLNFWKFLAGETISSLGTSFTMFALPLLVYQLTGSSLNLALSTAANLLPYLLFGLVIGAWADRLDRKRMMIIVDLLLALSITSIPVVYLLKMLTVWWIYGAGFVTSTLGIFFTAGQFAAIPSLVDHDDLVTANGRIQASFAGARILGPLLAGALLFVMPLPTLLFLDAASFLVSACTLSLVTSSFNSSSEKREKKHILRDVREGLRYVLHHPVLRTLSIMLALVNFIATTSNAQIVLFADRQLGAHGGQVSFLFAAGGAGTVVFSLLAGRLRKHWSFSRVALTTLAIDGLLILGLAFTHWFWAGVLLWALIQGAGILTNINTGSLRQAIVPNELLGRVISIAGVLAWSAIPLGSLLGGLLIQWTQNVGLVYAGIGILIFLIPVTFAFTSLGHVERYLPKTDEEPDKVHAEEALRAGELVEIQE